MIESKAAISIVYICLVLIVVLVPYIALVRGAMGRATANGGLWVSERDTHLQFAFLSIVAAAIGFLVFFGSTSRFVLSVLSTIPFVLMLAPAREARGWGSVAGFAVFSSVVWWPIDLATLSKRFVLFWLIGAISLWVYRRFSGATRLVLSKSEKWALFGALVVGVAANVFTGPVAGGQGFGTLWHHWGVYVAPAQLLTAGAVPFFDFPIQYGFGPMVTLALACQADCWKGAYHVVSGTNIAYLVTLVFCTTLLTRGMSKGVALLALAAMTSAVLLWTSYPPFLVGPLATPSTGGMRFLPLALLVACILSGEIQEGGALRPHVLGYAFWGLSMLWAPEAAIFATMVWWPYLTLKDIQRRNDLDIAMVLRCIGLGLGRMLLASCVLAGAFSIVFFIGFKRLPDIDGFLIYIVNPPGPMPANLGGPVWVLLTTLALAVVAMLRANDRDLRLVLVCALALLAVSSYYLGRSHDNNILNLFPFVLLTLIATLRVVLPRFLSGYATALILGFITWPSLFGFGALYDAARANNLGQIGSEHFLEMTSLSQSAWGPLDEVYGSATPPAVEAADALTTLKSLGDGSPVLINANFVLPRYAEFKAWTSIIDPASYAVLPADAIQRFIERGRQRWNRAGWLVVQPEYQGNWLSLFGSAYNVSETRKFGRYVAYRMVPK
jgi:hypothetical protein